MFGENWVLPQSNIARCKYTRTTCGEQVVIQPVRPGHLYRLRPDPGGGYTSVLQLYPAGNCVMPSISK